GARTAQRGDKADREVGGNTPARGQHQCRKTDAKTREHDRSPQNELWTAGRIVLSLNQLLGVARVLIVPCRRQGARPPTETLRPTVNGAERAHLVPELCRLRERQDLLGPLARTSGGRSRSGNDSRYQGHHAARLVCSRAGR